MNYSWLVFAFVLMLPGCASSKLEKSGIEKIEFGSGGGFTGRFQTYVVDLKQKVILNIDGTVKKTLSKEELKKLSAKIGSDDFSKISFDHPHNMTYFIHFQGKFNNKVVWGDPGFPAPEKIKSLHATLMELIK